MNIYPEIFDFQRVSRRGTDRMTWFPVCLFLALFANARLEPSYINGLRRNVVQPPETNLEEGAECTADILEKIVCEDDKLKFCGPNNRVTTTPCMVNGRQGFCNCDKTACVADRPNCSDEPTKCHKPKSKLPDNLDCHKFTYCNANSQKVTLQCPGNLIYEPNLEKCEDQITARCSRVVCPRGGNSLQLIPFPHARNFYVLCYQGMGDVRKCTDKFYAVRNNACQFDCKMKGESGLFRDTNVERCKKGIYYACRKTGTNFTTVQAKCATGMVFDESIGICTAEATCT